MLHRQKIQIVGVPSDLGANTRGANIGPAAIRIAHLHQKIRDLGLEIEDQGDIAVPIRDSLSAEDHQLKFRHQITGVCQSLCHQTYRAMAQDHCPVTIGGDHSIAIGSISGVSQYYHEQNQSFGLIWVDAHADINTPESSPSGNIHGMPLAVLLGQGHSDLTQIGGNHAKVDPTKTVLIGIRTVDAMEKEILRKSGITYFTMRDIDEFGMPEVVRRALKIANTQTQGLHVSFDIDAIDPIHAPGVSTPVTGGLSYREAHLLLEMTAETGKLHSMDFVELNPYTDLSAQSAHLTVDLILSALGKAVVD